MWGQVRSRTELFDETGEFLCKQGNEFGATTGRRRRTGWLDTVAVRRAVQLNSLSGFCLTNWTFWMA